MLLQTSGRDGATVPGEVEASADKPTPPGFAGHASAEDEAVAEGNEVAAPDGSSPGCARNDMLPPYRNTYRVDYEVQYSGKMSHMSCPLLGRS